MMAAIAPPGGSIELLCASRQLATEDDEYLRKDLGNSLSERLRMHPIIQLALFRIIRKQPRFQAFRVLFLQVNKA
jgi:hypothetical protein